jgi:hypothetical protein
MNKTNVVPVNQGKRDGSAQARQDITNINKGQTGFVLLFDTDFEKQAIYNSSIETVNVHRNKHRSVLDIAIRN